MASLNTLAQDLRALHKPGEPLILGNVYDGATASIVTSLPSVKAVATASFAIAATYGLNDNDMTREQNLAGIRKVASVVSKAGVPLTADLQDGYDNVKETIRLAIEAGAVGCNLEDVNNETEELRAVDDAVSRIKSALEAAAEAGVPDFALNARTDVLGFGGTIDDAIERGNAYLAAGANTVFVWGGPKGRGVAREEIVQLCEAFDGRLNVLKRIAPGFLTVPELKEIGVARISVGPGLYLAGMNAFKEAAEKLLSS
ncbi:carboxyphosphonoenolpyruvate phosphonomutase-like protein [Patellaria atrata CBS 101060]|uniref:Carboxyphosphonoenolpyruvate phosphonomutase-like protein n=1 Tax=Patellaria atrata CBS 101060 TaxID=1346257 RepID=A0A9P4VXH4_9PEZI|nr:carboxyphosphonoenolpyruvate phosphonomutase-like protein [Patellaria atrata CBS 101060]